jgi:hypothetical protein
VCWSHGWLVHGVAGSAVPGGVTTAVPETGLMTHQYRAGAELVAVRAARRRVGRPLSGGGLHDFTEQGHELVDLE